MAPLLPPPQEREHLDLLEEEFEPPRQSQKNPPNRQTLIIAAVATAVVLGGISIGLSMMVVKPTARA